MTDLYTDLKGQQDDIAALVRHLASFETFTADKQRVDAFADEMTQQFEALSADSITRMPQQDVGDILIAHWNDDAAGKPILILTHMDTVHRAGTLEQNPIHTDDEGRLYGPGTLDMKGGIAVALYAIKTLIARDEMPDRPIWLMATSDEETGSTVSEPYIIEAASQCELALVMEFPTPEGALKTGRKAIATYKLTTRGKASHAGNHPEAGVNAVLEMAHQIVRISELQDLRRGVSVAVNTIDGGVAPNVIAPEARATIDVRTFTQIDLDLVHEALMSLRPKVPGAQVDISVHHMRGPMERTDAGRAAFEQAQRIGKTMKIFVDEAIVGGGSDANIVATLGVPTLDGLGPRGAGAHTHEEHIIMRSLPQRTAHLAAILRDWQ